MPKIYVLQNVLSIEWGSGIPKSKLVSVEKIVGQIILRPKLDFDFGMPDPHPMDSTFFNT